MTDKTLRLILGNQLFPLEIQKIEDTETVFMCEDSGLCTYEKHHKSKIALFFNAMRSFRDSLEQSDIKNIYYDFNKRFNDPFIEKLAEEIKRNQFTKIKFFEIEDKPFEKEILLLVNELEITHEILKTPMFIDTRESFKEFIQIACKEIASRFPLAFIDYLTAKGIDIKTYIIEYPDRKQWRHVRVWAALLPSLGPCVGWTATTPEEDGSLGSKKTGDAL